MEALGVILHFCHIFSGYKENEVAAFAKGMACGITLAIDLSGAADPAKLLPDGKIPNKKGRYGIEQFWQSFYVMKNLDYSSIQSVINSMNNEDLSKIRETAEESGKRLVADPSSIPWFVDPGNKNKQ